eukprot:scaffold3058_cov165-Ochromonas_danica.AAC.46
MSGVYIYVEYEEVVSCLILLLGIGLIVYFALFIDVNNKFIANTTLASPVKHYDNNSNTHHDISSMVEKRRLRSDSMGHKSSTSSTSSSSSSSDDLDYWPVVAEKEVRHRIKVKIEGQENSSSSGGSRHNKRRGSAGRNSSSEDNAQEEEEEETKASTHHQEKAAATPKKRMSSSARRQAEEPMGYVFSPDGRRVSSRLQHHTPSKPFDCF